jgi:phenylalanyl-tRNA synthetase alpha chain
LLGCGMVDPNVFEFVKDNGYDPARVSGFAFGMGVERIAMLKWGIDDIQQFYYGDVRFLRQFA